MKRAKKTATLTMAEEVEYLARRYDCVAAAMPEAWTVPASEVVATLAAVIRILGARFAADFIVEMRQRCARLEEITARRLAVPDVADDDD